MLTLKDNCCVEITVVSNMYRDSDGKPRVLNDKLFLKKEKFILNKKRYYCLNIFM